MKDGAREYLDQPEPDYGPINARDRVIEDNDIDLGARLMFVRILDLSTRDGVRDHYGVVTISQQKLADKFGVSLRTIWNWKMQLVKKGVVWMGHKFMPNAWPMDTYHITELSPPGKTEGRTTGEGMWGNGKRRQAPDRIGLGAREPGQTIIPGTGARAASNVLHSETGFQTPEKSSFLPAIAAADRNPLPAAAATDCHSEPQPVAAGSRNSLPLGAATGCDSEPKRVATGSRNRLPVGAETGCEHKKSQSVGNSVSKVGEEALPTEKRFQDWLEGLPRFSSELRKLETDLTIEYRKAKTPERRRDLIRRIHAVKSKLLGSPVEDKAPEPKPVRTEPKPTMSSEQQKAAWEKAKAALPPSLKQKAALTADQANNQARLAAIRLQKAAAKAAART